ncbi:MAG: response regulator [Candidatus Odinarchaeota archaeon]
MKTVKRSLNQRNSGSQLSILHIDDDDDFLYLAKTELEQKLDRVTIDAVSSSFKALKLLETKKYDAVISDYLMPGLNGLELLEKLRKGGNEIPIIFVTGKGREEVVIQALNLGANFYLRKDNPETLFNELYRCISDITTKSKVSSDSELYSKIQGRKRLEEGTTSRNGEYQQEFLRKDAAELVEMNLQLRLENKRLEETREEFQKKIDAVTSYNESLILINNILRQTLLNDLTIIRGSLDLYRAENDKNYLENTLQAIDKSANLIKKLGKFANLVSLNDILKLYSIRDLVDDVLLDYKHRDVVLNVEGQGIALAGQALVTVIDNVIQNALIHSKTERIDIKIEKEGSFCTIKIIDYGTGIPAGIKSRLFNPVYDHNNVNNSCLGLYFSKKVINSYGGDFRVENTNPKGTTVIITLLSSEKENYEPLILD